MSAIEDFIKAVEITATLREGFKSLADLYGADEAFGYFAAKVCEEGYSAATEEKFVGIIRAAYDDYVAAKVASA